MQKNSVPVKVFTCTHAKSKGIYNQSIHHVPRQQCERIKLCSKILHTGKDDLLDDKNSERNR